MQSQIQVPKGLAPGSLKKRLGSWISGSLRGTSPKGMRPGAPKAGTRLLASWVPKGLGSWLPEGGSWGPGFLDP